MRLAESKSNVLKSVAITLLVMAVIGAVGTACEPTRPDTAPTAQPATVTVTAPAPAPVTVTLDPAPTTYTVAVAAPPEAKPECAKVVTLAREQVDLIGKFQAAVGTYREFLVEGMRLEVDNIKAAQAQYNKARKMSDDISTYTLQIYKNQTLLETLAPDCTNP